MEMASKNNPAICLARKLGYEFCGYNDHVLRNSGYRLIFWTFDPISGTPGNYNLEWGAGYSCSSFTEKVLRKVCMLSGWMQDLLTGIITVNQILTAGIAITAFSLFLYALSFNLRDRVARSFAIILLCVVTVFTSEALESSSSSPQVIDLFLRLEWFGIIFLPPAYLHLSDAILVTTGRPSRGRRRVFVRLIVCHLGDIPTACWHLDTCLARW